MKLQGRQHCHLVAKAVEKPRANRQAGASRSYVKKKKKKAGQKLLGLPFISSSPRRPGNVLLLPHSCIEEQCIPCQHSHCSSQHQAEKSMGCYKTYHLCLGLSGNVLLQLQVQPQCYRWRGEKQDCAITRILHPPSSSSAKSSPSGSAAPTCKS